VTGRLEKDVAQVSDVMRASERHEHGCRDGERLTWACESRARGVTSSLVLFGLTDRA